MSTSFALNLPPSLPEGRYVSTIVENTRNEHYNERYTRWTGVKSVFVVTRKKMTTALMGLMIVIMGFLGLVQASAPAQAFDPLGVGAWLDDNFCAPESRFRTSGPEVYGSGAILLTQNTSPVLNATGVSNASTAADDNFLNQRRTAYEKYGIMGTRWQNYRPAESAVNRTNEVLGIDREAGDRRQEANCFDPVSEVGNYFANFVFDGTKLVVLFTTWFYGAVYQPDFIDGLNEAVGTIISGNPGQPGLKDILYFEFLTLVLLFSALYLGWIGLVKKASTQAMTSGLWMFGAVMVGSLLVWNPTLLPNATNAVISQVEMALMRGTTGVALGITNANQQDNICYAPNAAITDDSLSINNPQGSMDRIQRQALEGQKDQVIRSMECVIWATFVYTPWVSGQFGMSPTEANDRLKFIEGDGAVDMGGPEPVTGQFALYQLDQQVIDRSEINDAGARLENTKNWFNIVAESMWAEDAPNATYADTWSGTADPGARVGVAFLSLISASVGLASIMVISLSILMYSVAMSMLMFVSVIFLLIGAHPGMGRGISLRWAEMYVGTIFKRIIAAALLGMIMSFYAIILSSPTLGFGTSLVAIVALSIAAISYRKSLMDAFTSFSFGGSNAGIENNRAFQRAGGAMGGAALGAAAVIGGGSALATARSAKGAAIAAGASQSAAARAGMGGAFKAIGAGSLRAAKSGAVSGRLDSVGAGFAAREADAVGQRTKGKYEARKATAERETETRRLASERETKMGITEQERREKRSNPAAVAKRRKDAERRKKQYANDYAEFGKSEEWRENFEKSYGFAPPVPNGDEPGFGGYGLDKNSEDYQEAQSWREAEKAQRARDAAVRKARASQDAVDDATGNGNTNNPSSDKTAPGSVPNTKNSNSKTDGTGQINPVPVPRSGASLPRTNATNTTAASSDDTKPTPKPMPGAPSTRNDTPSKPEMRPTGNGAQLPRPAQQNVPSQTPAQTTAKPRAAKPQSTETGSNTSSAVTSKVRAEIKANSQNHDELKQHEKEALRRKGFARTTEERQAAEKNLMTIRTALKDNRDVDRALKTQYEQERKLQAQQDKEN